MDDQRHFFMLVKEKTFHATKSCLFLLSGRVKFGENSYISSKKHREYF